MSKPRIPFPPAAVPPRSRRLALFTVTTLGGMAFASRHALAQGAGGTLGNRAAAIAQDMLNWGAVVTMSLYLIAGVALAAGVIAVYQIGRRNAQVSPAVPICAFLASFIAAGAGTWVLLGSNTLTGSAPSITGGSTQPIQFQ